MSRINHYGLTTHTLKDKDRTSQQYQQRTDSFNALRADYNNSTNRDYRDLFLLMCYSINKLIRFNSSSQFNASSGVNTYTDTIYQSVQDLHNTFKNVQMTSINALDLDLTKYTTDTFIYCDPPYLNTTAVYNEKRAFGNWNIDSDLKLFKLLEQANALGIKWGLSNVFESRGIKNKHLIKWCEDNNWTVHHLTVNYHPFSVGGSSSDEVYICNY